MKPTLLGLSPIRLEMHRSSVWAEHRPNIVRGMFGASLNQTDILCVVSIMHQSYLNVGLRSIGQSGENRHQVLISYMTEQLSVPPPFPLAVVAGQQRQHRAEMINSDYRH